MIVFDVDGVLADTRELVRAAYEKAGVSQDPTWFRLPWREWLPPLVGSLAEAEKIHVRKNKIYLEMLDSGPVRKLPAAFLARSIILSGEEHVYAISSGSHTAISALLRRIGLEKLTLIASGVDAPQRFAMLERLALLEKPGTYVDDHVFVSPIGWKFVHYRNQTLEELEQETWNS